jgi:hypothetical protein
MSIYAGNATVDANVFYLLVNTAVGTVLQFPDEKGTPTDVKLASKTKLIAAKTADGATAYTIRYADGDSEPVAANAGDGFFKNVNAAMQAHHGSHLIGDCWVKEGSCAAADKAIELNENPFPGMRGNPLYLTTNGNTYNMKNGKVGTKNNASVTTVKPQTLRILGEGVTPPSSPVKAAKAGASSGATPVEGGASAASPKASPEAPTRKAATKGKLLGAHKDVKGKTLAEIRASARKLRAAKDLRKIIELEGCTPRTFTVKPGSGKKPSQKVIVDMLRLQLDEIWG